MNKNLKIESNKLFTLYEKEVKSIPFESFPVYKRFPRLIKRLSTEKVPFELPREKEKPSKKGLIMTALPPLAMTGVTVAVVFFNILRWKRGQSHKSLAVPLGLRASRDILSLNLHEKAHGSHGMVAGTTGSGQSETIKSYILSLVVNFHPHEVGFLLIDYKGGGMANMFRDLPHLLGTITNLDGSESMRALASVKEKLARRQRGFSTYGVNHINGYMELFKFKACLFTGK